MKHFGVYPEHVMRGANLPKATVISIVGPGKEHPTITAKHLFQIQFNDTDQPTLTQDGQLVTPLATTEAIPLANFILDHQEEEFWVIHCEAGMSRSPGVALAIATFFEEREARDMLEGRFPLYNRHVRRVMEIALRKADSERYAAARAHEYDY